jgi:hypothetical protein
MDEGLGSLTGRPRHRHRFVIIILATVLALLIIVITSSSSALVQPVDVGFFFRPSIAPRFYSTRFIRTKFKLQVMVQAYRYRQTHRQL